MLSIFLVLNYPNDKDIEFLCSSEVAAGKMTCYIEFALFNNNGGRTQKTK
jgi:hypothetical protein